MSLVGSVASAVKTNFLSPKNLLIGVAVTAGTLFLLSRVVPGIGGMVGLRTAPMVPLNLWPFSVSGGNGSDPVPLKTGTTDSLEAAWNASM